MNAVTAAPSSTLSPYRLVLAVIGAINLVASLGVVTLGSVFSRMGSGFSSTPQGDDPGTKVMLVFFLQAMGVFLLGAFQLFASSQVKAQRRFLLCCVGFASLALPYSMFHYLGGACGLIALYKLTRPEVRSTFT